PREKLAGAWIVDSRQAHVRLLGTNRMDEEWLVQEALEPGLASGVPRIIDADDFVPFDQDLLTFEAGREQAANLAAIGIPLGEKHFPGNGGRQFAVRDARH